MVFRGAIGLLAIVSLSGLPYLLVGLINRATGRWHGVFYCYAGSPRFIASYAAPGLVRMFRWRPVPIGVMSQDGRLGLVLASPMTEADLLDPANAREFAGLQRRLARIARLTGAPQVSAAGILPGILRRSHHLSLQDNRPLVVAAVTQAVAQLETELPDGTRNLILVGGAGHIGRALAPELAAQGWLCHIIDPRMGTEAFPEGLRGRPAVLLDVSRAGVLERYVDTLWPGLVLLNEVFPAPSPGFVRRVRQKGVRVFHLAGVAGRIHPPLPHGYEGAIPCCAAFPSTEPPDVRLVELPHNSGQNTS